jgi:hypothetical protein
MVLVKQAIFTTLPKIDPDRYGIAAASSGLSQSELQRLDLWGPTVEDLLDQTPNGVSFNFFGLGTTDSFCISRTTTTGWLDDENSSPVAYTQCLILSKKDLARFANNPFLVLKSAMAHQLLTVYHEIPETLEAIDIPVCNCPVDESLLAQLNSDLDWEPLFFTLQKTILHDHLIISGSEAPELLISAVINCLPVECRPHFTFSTGLQFSKNRPLRIVAIGQTNVESTPIGSKPDWNHLNLQNGPDMQDEKLSGWPQFVSAILNAQDSLVLEKELAKSRLGLKLHELDLLGLELMKSHNLPFMAAETFPDDNINWDQENQPNGLQQAHAPHKRFCKTAEETKSILAENIAHQLALELSLESSDLTDKLELLERSLFEVATGQPESIEKIKKIWAEMEGRLPKPTLSQIREAYLRLTLSLWHLMGNSDDQGQTGLAFDDLPKQPSRNPDQSVWALEILSILVEPLT